MNITTKTIVGGIVAILVSVVLMYSCTHDGQKFKDRVVNTYHKTFDDIDSAEQLMVENTCIEMMTTYTYNKAKYYYYNDINSLNTANETANLYNDFIQSHKYVWHDDIPYYICVNLEPIS